ncbi:hypothetical protein, partial [Escherichia coli]
NDVTLKMPAFEWVHVQLHQQKGMISLSPPTICNSARRLAVEEHLKRFASLSGVCCLLRVQPLVSALSSGSFAIGAFFPRTASLVMLFDHSKLRMI